MIFSIMIWMICGVHRVEVGENSVSVSVMPIMKCGMLKNWAENTNW